MSSLFMHAVDIVYPFKMSWHFIRAAIKFRSVPKTLAAAIFSHVSGASFFATPSPNT
jgi:hypothetical protein